MRYGKTFKVSRHGWLWPFTVSLILKAFLSFQDAVLNSDGVAYIEAARLIAEGHFSQSLLLYPMPAYPLLIATMHCLVPDWIIAAKLISVVSSALITIPIYSLTAILFGRRAAFYAALSVALLPSLNDLAPDVIRDPCFLLFACGSVYWMAKACMTERISGVLMAFVLAGAALLFRIEAVSLFMAYLIYLAGVGVFAPAQRHFAAKALLFFVAPALIGMVGLIAVGATAEGVDRIDQLRTFGQKILSGRFLARYQDIYAHLKDLERLAPGTSGELYKLARHYMPLLYIIGMLESFFRSLFWPYAAALWIGRRNLANKGMHLVIITIVFHSLLVLLYFLNIDYLSSRYLLFCALLAIPLVGQGGVLLEGMVKRLSWRKPGLIAIIIVFVALPLYRSIAQGFGEDKAIALAGQWLSDKTELRRAEWAVDDLRYYLYADKTFNLLKERNDAFQIGKLTSQKDFNGVETQAREAGKTILILRIQKGELNNDPDFGAFRKVKQIESPQSKVLIYEYQKP